MFKLFTLDFTGDLMMKKTIVFLSVFCVGVVVLSTLQLAMAGSEICYMGNKNGVKLCITTGACPSGAPICSPLLSNPNDCSCQ